MFKVFASFLITSFLTTAFFCSCEGSGETFLASDVHHGDADGCDSPQGKTHSSEKHCDCNLTKMVNADITAKTVLVVPGNVSHQPFNFSTSFKNKDIGLRNTLIYVHGPPGPIVVVPFYIQFHSLRI
jgi:hypothetical protein